MQNLKRGISIREISLFSDPFYAGVVARIEALPVLTVSLAATAARTMCSGRGRMSEAGEAGVVVSSGRLSLSKPCRTIEGLFESLLSEAFK
jgi:hypothetical protein